MATVKKVILGSDHAGFPLKTALCEHLQSKGMPIVDAGVDSAAAASYAPIAHNVSRMVQEENVIGVLICGSGIGMSMAANRSRGVRAALCHNTASAALARSHNDANILVLSGRFLESSEGVRILDAFLNTNFEGGRHVQRVADIDEAEG